MPTNQLTGQPDPKPYLVQLLPDEAPLDARARWMAQTGWAGPIMIQF